MEFSVCGAWDRGEASDTQRHMARLNLKSDFHVEHSKVPCLFKALS